MSKKVENKPKDCGEFDMNSEEAQQFLASPEGKRALKDYKKLNWINKMVESHKFSLPEGDLAPLLLEQVMIDFVAEKLHPDVGHSMSMLRPILMRALRDKGYKLVKKSRVLNIECPYYLEAPNKKETPSESIH